MLLKHNLPPFSALVDSTAPMKTPSQICMIYPNDLTNAFLSFSSIHRLREPPHSERDITSPILPAVVAERLLSTSKRRHALPVDTPTLR